MMKQVLIGAAAIVLLNTAHPAQYEAFSDQVIQRGAFGDDVIELQARLQYIGYYTGTIDGKFGYSTYWELRNFQEQYGLPIDGIEGTSTKRSEERREGKERGERRGRERRRVEGRG